MTELDFSTLRHATPECPSDKTLDALHLKALSSGDAAVAQGHVVGCPHCTARMAQLARGFDAFAQLDERRILAAVRRAQTPQRRAWRWLPWAAGLLATTAIAIIWLLPAAPVGSGIVPVATGVRIKGKAVLRVFVETPKGSKEVPSGSALTPGTRFKFAVDLPAPGAVRIMGKDANGTYSAWAGSLPVGKNQILPGATTLDDAPGAEHLFLVHCPAQSVAPKCPSTNHGLKCPKPCTVSTFVIERSR